MKLKTLTKKPITRQPIWKPRQQRLEDLKNLFVQKKENIVWIVYEQGKIFQIFKEKEKVNIMVRNFNVNKSMITFKINIVKPATKYPRLIKSSILLNFLKTYFKDDLAYLNRNLQKIRLLFLEELILFSGKFSKLYKNQPFCVKFCG